MRSLFQQAQLIFVISTVFLLSSCGDESEPVPDVPPLEVILSTSANSTVVWNTAKLSVTATSGHGIDKIDLKIDGVSVGEATSSPYEFSWDTNDASDGPHTATATVTDKSGNKETTELRLTVQNTLLEAKINSDMLRTKEDEYDERGFIFLSDEKGKVIVAQEFKNGDEISFKAPTFDGGEFTVSEVVTSPKYGGYTITTITSTPRVSRGKWVLKAPYAQISAGVANVSFTNRDDNLDYYLNTNDLGTYYLNGTHASGLNLQTSPSKLYVKSQPKDGSGVIKYHMFNSIVTGTNPDALDLSLVNKPLTEETISLPEGMTKGSIFIYGLHKVDNTSQIYHIGSTYNDDGMGKLTIQYPATGFDSFYSWTRLTDAEYSALNVSNSSIPYDLVPLEGTLNASLAGREITYSATGDMDIINFFLSHNYLDWTIFAEKSAASVVIPELPAILNDVVNLNAEIDDVAVTMTGEAYPQIQDYSSYLDFVRASTHGYIDLRSSYVAYKHLHKKIFNDVGGRKATGDTVVATPPITSNSIGN